MERNYVAWKSKVEVFGLTGSIEEVNLFGLKYDAHEWQPIKLLNNYELNTRFYKTYFISYDYKKNPLEPRAFKIFFY